jgi:hypothetical protein
MSESYISYKRSSIKAKAGRKEQTRKRNKKTGAHLIDSD